MRDTRAGSRKTVAATLGALAVATVLLVGCGASGDGGDAKGDTSSTTAKATSTTVAETTTTTVAASTTATTLDPPATTAATTPPTSPPATTPATTPASTEPNNGLAPGDPCSQEEGSPDCIDPENDGSATYLIGGADCMANSPLPEMCADLDGDGYAGYPDGG